MDMRKIILRRLAELDKSRYWLAEQLGDAPSRTSVYAFLRGETDIFATHLGRMLAVLELEVRVKEGSRGSIARPKRTRK